MFIINMGASLSQDLIEAVKIEDVQTFDNLLLKGVDVNAIDAVKVFEQKTALIHAASNGNAYMVKMLLEHGADVNAADFSKSTSLIHAARNGNASVVVLLLKAGADVNAGDVVNNTAFDEALEGGHVFIMKLLLESGSRFDADSALSSAIRREQKSAVKLCIKHGANVNAVNGFGETPLMSASMNSRASSIVELLLAAGANVNAVDNIGNTALSHALSLAAVHDYSSYYYLNAKILLEYGADGTRDLVRHSKYGEHEHVSFLLRAGVNVNAFYREDTPLSAAVKAEHVNIVKLLLTYPKIHASVDAAEAFITNDDIRTAFEHWHLIQAVCVAARAPAVRAASVPPELAAALDTAKKADVGSEEFSYVRDLDGFTALGGAVAARASKQVLRALMNAGCNILLSVDMTGLSMGTLAARTGRRATSDWLYRAATKENAKMFPQFRYVRSLLVVGTSGERAGRPFIPVDVLNYIMDFCDATWFDSVYTMSGGGMRYRGQAVTIRKIRHLPGNKKEVLIQRADGKLKLILVGGGGSDGDDDDDDEVDLKRITHAITLVSSDDSRFTVPGPVAEMSSMIRRGIMDQDDAVVPVQVTGKVLEKVLEWCTYHASHTMNPIYKPVKSFEAVVSVWDADFVNKNMDMIFEIIQAANYMDIHDLLDLTCAKVASLIKDKTRDEILKVFNIDPDFTAEEIKEINKEDAWYLTGGRRRQ